MTAAPYMHPRLERLSAGELRALQGRKLRALVRRAGAVDGYHRRRLRTARVDPDAVRSADDVARLPFSTKETMIADQAEHPPMGSRLLVDEREVARISLSGGSSGRGRELVAHTREDLLVLGGLQATVFRWGGVGESDTVAFNVPVINATASLAFPLGVEAVGRIKYLIGHESFAERVQLLRTHGATAVWGTPSMVNGLTAEFRRHGLHPRDAVPGVRLVVSEGYGSTQTHGGQCMATCGRGVTQGERRGGMHVFDWRSCARCWTR